MASRVVTVRLDDASKQAQSALMREAATDPRQCVLRWWRRAAVGAGRHRWPRRSGDSQTTRPTPPNARAVMADMDAVSADWRD
jgi:hypothetical protein